VFAAIATILGMGYRHSREDLLAAATEVVLEGGLGALSFGKVGQRLGISDRTVVYYFPNKPDLVMAVVGSLAGDLVGLLEQAFGEQRRDGKDLLDRAWPVLTTDAADRVFAIYFEVVGLASAGQAPYGDLAAAMVDGWVTWLAERTVGSTAEIRHRRALALVAQVDGLLLLRRVLGPQAAETARRELAKTL
jgi:AcrR family transcriptional regulator